jgi:predicted dehydrogenase
MNSIETLKIGIVATGMISNVIAESIKASSNSEIAAVSSRSAEKAKEFATNHQIAKSFSNWNEMVNWDGIDAIYIGVPTIAKEEIAIAAAKNGKHLLVDKPFLSLDSVKRMTAAAHENKVVFMDATHFVHHPRTTQIQSDAERQVGIPQAVNSSFFFPFLDRSNIRYNSDLEPTGAIGDMTWYSARAIVEYLPNSKNIKDLKTFVQRDPESKAILRAAGIIIFEGGSTSTWDIGYNTGVCVMDLDIFGSEGVISLDDFVLDWNKGFAFDNPEHKVGYTLRKGMATPKEFQFIETPSEKAQEVLMIENFADLVKDQKLAMDMASKAEHTQMIVDAIWDSIEY